MAKGLDSVLSRVLKEAKAIRQKEARAEMIAAYRRFLKRFTRNGKWALYSAGGNFWMRGTTKKHCSHLRPEVLVQLVDAGVLERIGGGGYRYVPETK